MSTPYAREGEFVEVANDLNCLVFIFEEADSSPELRRVAQKTMEKSGFREVRFSDSQKDTICCQARRCANRAVPRARRRPMWPLSFARGENPHGPQTADLPIV